MKTENLKDLFMEIYLLYGDIARFKLQNKILIGFRNKEKLDKLNKLIDKSKREINRYADVGFSKKSNENPRELVTLIKTLSKLDDTMRDLPEEVKEDDLYIDITERTVELINKVSQYNYLRVAEALI